MKIDKKTINFNKIWDHSWPYLITILFVLLLLIPQISHGVLLKGADTKFHFARFYDAAMQLKTGKVNFFQTNATFGQSGRVINAMYGSGFAVLNGSLLLIARTWYNYELLTNFLINLIGASTMLYLLSYLKVKRYLAIMISWVYICCGMIPFFVDSTAYNGWGQAFMPLVLLCAIKMVQDHHQPINWLQFALVMSILAQVHVLSTMMAVGLLLPFFVIGCLKNTHWVEKMVVPAIKAVMMTIVLTGNIWAPILALKSSNLATPAMCDLTKDAVRIGKYHLLHGHMGNVTYQVLPIFFILLVLQLIYVLFHLQENIVNSVTTLWGCVLLFIASTIFPWGMVQDLPHLTALRNTFQFPYRLTVIAYPMLLVGIALTLNKYLSQNQQRKYKVLAGIGVALLVIENIGSTYIAYNHYTVTPKHIRTAEKIIHSENLHAMFKPQSYGGRMVDYLPIKGERGRAGVLATYKKHVLKNYKYYHHRVLADGSLQLTWTAKKAKAVYLPVVLYKRSHLLVNEHSFNGSTDMIHSPKITQNVGKNMAILNFVVPKWFGIILSITLIAWLIVIGHGIYRIIKITR